MTGGWDWNKKPKSNDWRNLTTDQRADLINQARDLIAAGHTWHQAADALGLSYDTMRRRLDPVYDKACAERLRYKNRKRDAAEYAARKEQPVPPKLPDPISEPERHARIAKIPPDTRTLTQRMFGDPLPARSALAQRGAA